MAGRGQGQGQGVEYGFTQHTLFAGHSYPRTGARFKDAYDIKEELGKGGFGTVNRCVSRGAERREFAAKLNNTPERAKEQEDECVCSAALSATVPVADTLWPNFPNFTAWRPSRHIVNLFDSIREGDIVYNIYEIASGGDLQDEIQRKEFFDATEACFAFKQIIEGVNHMHHRGWLHRDLKPQNILVEHKNRKVYKVADFGLCKERLITNPDDVQRYLAAKAAKAHDAWNTPLIHARTYVRYPHGEAGTYMYNCPQKFLQQPYDVKSDWWSCACILYYMLAGYPPFYGDRAELLPLIANPNDPIRPTLEYPSPEWDNPDPVFVNAKNLLHDHLFINNEQNRYNFAQIMAHPFIAQTQIPPLPPFVAHDFTLADYEARKLQKRNTLRTALGLPPLQPDQQPPDVVGHQALVQGGVPQAVLPGYGPGMQQAAQAPAQPGAQGPPGGPPPAP